MWDEDAKPIAQHVEPTTYEVVTARAAVGPDLPTADPTHLGTDRRATEADGLHRCMPVPPALNRSHDLQIEGKGRESTPG